MKKIAFILVFAGLVVSGKLSAQGDYTSIQYVMSFGTGDIADYISNASFRGGVIDYHKQLNTNLLAGIEFGWNTFYEKKDYDTYTKGNASLSGIQYRYSNNSPLLVTAEYHLQPENSIKPYANFGLGTMYTKRSTDMGMYRITEDTWHFAIKPELGFMIDLGISSALKIAAKYYIGFGAGDLETQSYLGISAGFAFWL